MTSTPPPTATRSSALLTAAELDGLSVALVLERRSFASYAQVIADLGDVRPFVNVLAAEQTHVDQIKALFLKYAAPIPEDASSALERYSTVASACAAAAQNEQHLVATYDQLLGATLRADMQTVYRNLQAASRDNHLPAFTRC